MIYRLILALFLFYFLPAKTHSQDLKPTDTEALVTVTVTDFNALPEPDALLQFYGKGNDLYYSGITDSIGKFVLLLPQGNTFLMKCEKYGFVFDFGEREIQDINGPYRLEINFQIKIDTVYQETYTLENIYFEFDKAMLKPESFPSLDLLVKTLKENPKMFIEIAGHTDNVGDYNYNLTLSTNRAFAVRNYLIQKGISSKRVNAKGYGDTSPVGDNESDDGRQQNRRTEVRIITQ